MDQPVETIKAMQNNELNPDICVIGAGSGGLTVAAAAAAFGVDVVLIEKGKMGGDCLNYGCVPSKAILAAGKAAKAHKASLPFGVEQNAPVIDFSHVHEHVHNAIATIAPHDSVERFEGLGVTVIQGEASFVDEKTVQVGPNLIRPRRFVIATGSRAAVPPIKGLEDTPYLTNESLFDLTDRPEHLIVVGAGPIGMEMAQAHARLGSKVTVVEAQRALGVFEREAAELVIEQLKAEGVEVLEGTAVNAAQQTQGGVQLTLTAPDGSTQELHGSHLLIATGRKPNIEGLNLAAAGINHTKQGVTVDKGLRSSNPKVYAVGDVAGVGQFTHLAGAHGSLAVRSILFRLPVDHTKLVVPATIYTDPEIGQVGLSLEQAKAQFGSAAQSLRAPFSGNDRAVAERETKGWVELVVGKKGRIVGATVVGPQAGELLGLITLMITKRMKVSDLMSVIFPYPTLSEAIRRAALSYYAEAPKKPIVRTLLGLLRKLG